MKKKSGMTVKIEKPQDIKVNEVLYAAMEKYGPSPIVKQLWSNCLMESAYSNSPLIGFISTKKHTQMSLDNTDAANVLYYTIKHWDELKEKGKEEFEKFQEEHKR